MGYIDAWNGTIALCSTTTTQDYPSISITFNAQTKINRIVLIPPVCNGATEQIVDVYLDNYSGTSTLCGSSLPSIFTTFDFTCGGASGY
jgi:hypothetical protein